MKISFGELRIGEIAKKNLQKVIDTNWASEGPQVREFEQKFAALFGYKHAIAMSSGTDADICACTALYDFGAKRGDEIIVPAACFVACGNSVLAAGMTPKFVDVKVETLNIDPSKIEEAITDKTRAIMAVHTMGKPCDMDPILKIADKHNLKVIEDSCEAHGAMYKGKVIGTIGDIGTFSFYAAHLIVCGEGGMAVTNNDNLAGVIRSVKSHGRPPGSIYFDFQRVGYNSKMNDMEAAIGLEGIANFDKTFSTRKSNIYKLLDMTKDLSDYCYFLKEEDNEKISPHAFSLVLKDPKYDLKGLYRHLESNGIQCKTIFGSLPTQHNAFKFLGYKLGDFPAAEYLGNNGLHFGIHQYLTDDDLKFVHEKLEEHFDAKAR
ncbi:MAG: DegT/DnrJ/EryC1/StrS family aminotransferase [DPANN group archaeon]|nr:DegT/DnrJ/EryC1/StrS family aminotransferase [DPANN group archaeon]